MGGISLNAGVLKAVGSSASNSQFNYINKLFSFDKKLFGVHTNSGKPSDHVNATTGGYEGNWLAQFTDKLGVAPSATIIVPTYNYLNGSIRFPNGTFSNYVMWSDGYMAESDGARKEIFQKDNTYNNINTALTNRGITDRYTIEAFALYADELPDSQIHCSLNVYTQTVAEAISGVDKFKQSVGVDRVVYWEMGNEIGNQTYVDQVNNNAYAGSFANLTGSDLIQAKSIFPAEQFNGAVYGDYVRQVAEHIRENYPNDKIGLVSNYISRWNRPDGNPSFIPAVEQFNKEWAKQCINHVSVDNFDAVVMHPYINMTVHWNNLATHAMPASGKVLDVSFSDQEDKHWRYHVCVAQEFMKHVMDDKNEYWPKDKELWCTEWGCLTEPDAADVTVSSGICNTTVNGAVIDTTADFVTDGVQVGDWAINVTNSTYSPVKQVFMTALSTENTSLSFASNDEYKIVKQNQPEGLVLSNPSQDMWRMNYVASMLISIAEQNIKWRGKGEVTTSMFHALARGDSFSNSMFLSGYLNANGIVGAIFAKAIENMTHMSIPTMDDSSVQFYGIAQYENIIIHPVRAIYFEDGATQRLVLVNMTPDNMVVSQFFSTYTSWSIAEHSVIKTPFTAIPDSTYASIDDLDTDTGVDNITLCPAFSITLLENTGEYVTVGDSMLTVTKGAYVTGSIYSGTKDVTTTWSTEAQASGVNAIKCNNGTVDVNIGWGATPELASITRVTVTAATDLIIPVTGNYIGWQAASTGTIDVEQSVIR